MEKNKAYFDEELVEQIDKLLQSSYPNLIKKFRESEDIRGAVLVGSYSKSSQLENSDIDLAIIVKDDYKEKHIQCLHYIKNNRLLDILIFEENEIINNTRPRLFNVILKEGKTLFSKSDALYQKIKEIALRDSTFKTFESELDSVWFHYFWRVNKAKYYLPVDKDISDLVCLQIHGLIALTFSKFWGVENYSYTSNLKFMRDNHQAYWKKFVNFANSNEDRIQKIEELLKELPGYKKFSKKESFTELDNFISPITVLEGELDESKIVSDLNSLIL